MKSRGLKGLASRYRPKTFSEIVGLEKTIRNIQALWESNKHPNAFIFSGETGTGKTTIARIISVSVNCTHQAIFGEPCVACRKKSNEFDYTEINASDDTKVDDIRNAVSGYDYLPTPPSKYRVYNLDEAQRLSANAQNYLLKPFEDAPASTLWIICTTNPQKILGTLRGGRCVHFQLPVFNAQTITRYTKEIIDSERSQGNIQESIPDNKIELFSENLYKQRINTPRNILAQLEKFLVSGDPECVFGVGVEGDVRFGKMAYEGNWQSVRTMIKNLTDQELLALRYALMSYFRAILLNQMAGSEADKLSKSIEELAMAGNYDDTITGHRVISTIYQICRRFGVRTK